MKEQRKVDKRPYGAARDLIEDLGGSADWLLGTRRRRRCVAGEAGRLHGGRANPSLGQRP